MINPFEGLVLDVPVLSRADQEVKLQELQVESNMQLRRLLGPIALGATCEEFLDAQGKLPMQYGDFEVADIKDNIGLTKIVPIFGATNVKKPDMGVLEQFACLRVTTQLPSRRGRERSTQYAAIIKMTEFVDGAALPRGDFRQRHVDAVVSRLDFMCMMRQTILPDLGDNLADMR